MFIDTLEFTIPIDLCALYATLQEEARSQLEFPASVNSYGTTQDANVQVALRANKVTFKVDGVSSNASIISKSECKTLKLSVFDVDRTLMQKNVNSNNSLQNTLNNSNAAKRMHEQSVSFPSSKHSRKSYDDSPHPRSPTYHSPHQKSPHMSQASNSYSKPSNDTPVNVKQEPEDPDCIEIEPDPEPDDIVPKKETPYMQIDYSSNVPHTQTSQAALERLSFPPTSRSQSSSSSFHQNVPHVQDYSEPGPSQGHHDDQSADDFLVFQDDNECNDDYEEADYSNDDKLGTENNYGMGVGEGKLRFNNGGTQWTGEYIAGLPPGFPGVDNGSGVPWVSGTGSFSDRGHSCPWCGKVFANPGSRWHHVAAVHNKKTYECVCGLKYNYSYNLIRHKKRCPVVHTPKS